MAVSDIVKALSPNDRKNHFENFLRDKARELNSYNDDIEKQITDYVNAFRMESFEGDELQLGGKKGRKTRKTRKSKQLKKTRSSKKSRQLKKTRKTKKSRK
jgi:hypothetical protein